MGCLMQEDYALLTIFRFATCSDTLPRDDISPLCEDMDMRSRSVIYNYTNPSNAVDAVDRRSGTLSPAALQTILEYTTRPGDVVVTFNAQFGAIYEAAENCGRLVFGSEGFEHFGNDARVTVTTLIGDIPADEQQGKAKKRVEFRDSDEEDPTDACE